MPVYDYDHDLRIITVPSPTVQVTVQELVNDIREEERDLAALNRPRIALAEGKLDLGTGGKLTGISLTLVNGWRLAFEARPGPTTVLVSVLDGNLLAQDEFEAFRFPIFPTAFTSGFIAQSTEAALINNNATLASAVWDKLQTDHVIAGSFGAAMRHLLGLAGENKVVEVLTKNGNGLPTSQRIRIYDTPANATTDDGVTGLVEEYTVTDTLTGDSLDKHVMTT